MKYCAFYEIFLKILHYLLFSKNVLEALAALGLIDSNDAYLYFA